MASDGEVHPAEARLVSLVHDIRTPLTIIAGFAELLQRRGDDLSPEQRAEFVDRIVTASAEMRELLDAERAGRGS